MHAKMLIAVPVYNEEKTLEKSIISLYEYTQDYAEDDWEIIIANNGSTDRTQDIAEKLAGKLPRVNVEKIKEKGRGNAIKSAWIRRDADVYAYCDVDLSTSLEFLKPLFNAIIEGNDIAIGSRHHSQSKVQRSLRRSLLSKGYNMLVRLFFKTDIKDFQCGFKAVNKKVVREILPDVKNKRWFFDTELLLLAERRGYKIKQIPVTWSESTNSKVNVFLTVAEYCLNILRLKLTKR